MYSQTLVPPINRLCATAYVIGVWSILSIFFSSVEIVSVIFWAHSGRVTVVELGVCKVFAIASILSSIGSSAILICVAELIRAPSGGDITL